MDNKEIKTHQTNECNRQIQVIGRSPGAGGAFTRYDIFGPKRQMLGVGEVPTFGLNLRFQDGPVFAGVNGITNEVLLAIVQDRLEGFQAGKFANPKNADALTHIRVAMDALGARTAERIARGVEGTHTP